MLVFQALFPWKPSISEERVKMSCVPVDVDEYNKECCLLKQLKGDLDLATLRAAFYSFGI